MRLKISDSIQQALDQSKPVVALESTIISHGMPWPQNFETALQVEQVVRQHGAVPATIGIIDGQLHAGLTEAQIERIAKAGSQAVKVSRRDLAFAINDKSIIGATTVASTMIIASMAGIKVFATGGIGGVHRNAETTMDISADLTELARTDVAVVCGGAKSILDLALTREYLETQGVPVIGYQTDVWPAFYTRTTDLQVDYRLNSAQEIADVLNQKWSHELRGGVVVCAPVPEQYAMDESRMEETIQVALTEMESLGIKGKETTPFLLQRIVAATNGKSLETNIQLVLNNAAVASDIAKAM